MPEISVIIPLYNKGKYIARAIDSVLNQSFKDFELIVVDDGSSDEGPVIVKRYEESRIKLIRQQNAGPGAARNKGLSESNCPLVAFLDADDEWMPEFLERCYKALVKNPDCDVIAAAYYLGQERKDISAQFRRRGMSDGRWMLDVDTKASELKHAIYILHSSSTLCKRKTIEKYGGFYEKDNCKLGEDYYLWLQIMFNHRIYRILKPLWWFHIEASESASAAAQQKCSQPFLTETERIKNNCPHYLLPVLDKWYAQYAIALAQELSFAGENRRAAKLIKQFPKMKDYRWEYFKLRTKMIAPQLIPMVRFFKQYARQV